MATIKQWVLFVLSTIIPSKNRKNILI